MRAARGRVALVAAAHQRDGVILGCQNPYPLHGDLLPAAVAGLGAGLLLTPSPARAATEAVSVDGAVSSLVDGIKVCCGWLRSTRRSTAPHAGGWGTCQAGH